MGWSFRDPRSYPAAFFTIHRTITSDPDEWHVFSQFSNHQAAQEAAIELQQFRHHIRHKRCQFTHIKTLIEGWAFYSRVEVVETMVLLYVRARPKFLADLSFHNPGLAAEILAVVND